MSVLTWGRPEVTEAVRAEVERQQAMPSDAARWTCAHWWLRRVLSTAAHPGSVQHQIACGVIARIAPQQIETHLRAGPPRRGDAD